MSHISEGSCLRFPEHIPPAREVSYEAALSMLLRAMNMAQNVPFSWGYIDKPSDGTVLLLYLPQTSPFPNDGIRWLETELKMMIPAGAREIEVCEVKFGFIPGSGEPNASRLRRRYRLLKGGNPQLALIHYSRGPTTMIQNQLANQPIRAYPLRQINEPSVFVAGEKQGQKVFTSSSGAAGPGPVTPHPPGQGQGQGMQSQGGGGMQGMQGAHQAMQGAGAAGGIPGPGGIPSMGPNVGGGGMGMPSGSVPSGGPSSLSGSSIPGLGSIPNMNMGIPGGGGSSGGPGGMGGSGGGGGGMPHHPQQQQQHPQHLQHPGTHHNPQQQAAMLAQQNSQMEALERRRERAAAVAAAAGQRPQGGHPRMQHDDDESGDEIDQLSMRTLALARYKRNHDWMNEVFCQAAFGKVLSDNSNKDKEEEKKKTPYSTFSKTELEGKVATLQKEIESLQTISALRRAEKIKAAQEELGSIGGHGGIGSENEGLLVA